MNLLEIIAELQKEKEILEEAIQALNRLTERRITRRGRPPQWLKDALGGKNSPTKTGKDSG